MCVIIGMGENVTTLYGSTTGPSLHQNIALVKSLLMNFVMNKIFFRNNIKMNKNILLISLCIPAIAFGGDSLQDRIERLQKRFNVAKKEKISAVTEGIMQKREALAKHVEEMQKDCPAKDCEKGLAYVAKIMRTERAREFAEDYVKDNLIEVDKVLEHNKGSALSQEQQDHFDQKVVHPLMALGSRKMLWIAVDSAVKGQRGRAFREKMEKEHAAVFGGLFKWEDLGKNEQQRQMRDEIVLQFRMLRIIENETYEKEMKHLGETNDAFAQELSKAVDYEYKGEGTVDTLKFALKQLGVDPDKDTVDKSKDGKKDGGLFGRK